MKGVSLRLTNIYDTLRMAHPGEISNGHLWLGAIKEHDECGCDLCKAMEQIILLEVDLTMGGCRISEPEPQP